MKLTFKKLAYALLPLFAVCSLQAISITPTSYSFDIAPSGSYPDSTGTELIDGVDGSDPWPAPHGTWVGWLNSNPTITFNFASLVTINTVSIEFQGNGAGGIHRPQSVTIGGTTTVAVADVGTPAVEYLDFNGSWTGTSLTVKLVTRSEWIFVDEIKFSNNVPSGNAGVPDTGSTAALLGAGLMGLVLIRRQAKRK